MNLELSYYKPDKIKKRFEKTAAKAKELEALYEKAVEQRTGSVAGKSAKRIARLAHVFNMRVHHSFTFREIGESLGVTRQRALQLYQEAQKASVCP